MPTIGNLTANLGINSNPWISGLNKSARSMGGFVKNVTSGFAQIGLAAQGAKTVFGALIGPMQEAQDAALAERKFAQVLKSTGNAAGVAKDEIMAYAKERQKMTSFDADDIVGGAGVLGSFTNIKGNAFTQALTSAQDLSAFLGQDLQSSILMVGKALNDPAKGLTALSRAGIQFSQAQKEQIKALQEVGDLAGAQQIILKEMQTQFGGQAKALVDPIMQAKNAWGDAMEDIGAIANEKLLPMMPKLIEGFEKFSDIVVRTVDGLGKMAESIQYTSFVVTALGSGMSLKDAKAAYDEAFGIDAGGGAIGGAAAMKAGLEKNKAMTGGMEKFWTVNPDMFDPLAKEEDFQKKLKADFESAKNRGVKGFEHHNQAGQMMAGLIRDGLGFMESSLMSLGPAVREGGPAKQLGTLEAGTRESFEVMRANVGAGKTDVQEKQLAEAQKQTKLLETLTKKEQTQKEIDQYFRIMESIRDID
jgi:hypothetical protein